MRFSEEDLVRFKAERDQNHASIRERLDTMVATSRHFRNEGLTRFELYDQGLMFFATQNMPHLVSALLAEAICRLTDPLEKST